MFRAGKEKRNLKPQGREDRDAGQAWGALPERMGKSTAELHPLQLAGKFIEISIKTGAPTRVWAMQLNTPFQGKKIPQKHLKYLH